MLRRILKELTKNVMKKNKEFHHLHRGEECYIIGNGDSIKYFDLDKFKDRISFGCNVLRAHNDFSKLNLKYYVNAAPLLYSPFWRGVKHGLYLEKNPYFKLQTNFTNTGYTHFVHASNYYFINNKSNYRFVHNLNKHPIDLDFNDFTTSSSFVDGGLLTMIGLAIYMGFKKAYLVGCDYFFNPYISGHFWSRFERIIGSNKFFYTELMNLIEGTIDLTVITTKGISSHINSIQYEEFFGVNENYKDPEEIISQRDLYIMDKTLYTRGM